MAPGDIFTVRGYTLQAEAISEEENDNYVVQAVRMGVFQKGKRIATLEPERRFYKSSEQQTTEVGIRSTLKEDLYVVFAGTEGERAIVQAYVNPLVSWVWIGGVLMILGTFIAMLPEPLGLRPEAAARKAAQEGSKERIPVGAVSLFLFWSLLAASPVWASTPAKTTLTDPAEVQLFKEVSREMTCQCGCSMNLSVCNHTNCPWGIPARLEIEEKIKKGYLRDEILQQFLARFGTGVRAAPPAKGFLIIYWLAPFVALAAGGVAASAFILRWKGRTRKGAGKNFEIDPEMKRRIEEELERF
jgi:cytochrome c-type biogenesis protein CcmH/NrfF